MKKSTRRWLFMIATLALVSTMPFLLKMIISIPVIELLLLDFDEWEAQQS
ncbi:hypothetical protein [Tetragenococcus solitarius]|uniref:Uncharacterized protein n=1 Tax=Tetragenococcus solitarius TaxID=71453 RepID=A0ABN3Y6D0_9ENTE|nr:hypothetical protein [Tetragenococcus solitarius]